MKVTKKSLMKMPPLNPQEQAVILHKGTEAPGSGIYTDNDSVNENLPNSSKKGKSQHTKCEALDLGFNSKNDLKKVYLAIHNNIIPNLNNQVFSQVILEKFSSSKIGWLHIALKTPKWSRGTEFKISYDGSSYVDFDKTQNMVDKF